MALKKLMITFATRFKDYQKNHAEKGCQAKGNGKRVLLSGFGLFSGAPYNISGATVASMASETFWPSEVDLENLPKLKSRQAQSGKLTAKDFGVKIENRSLILNGQNYDVCFLVLDVQWDLASAIILDQAAKFQPQLILMSGRGGSSVSLEAGALNTATLYAGFDSEGNSVESNRPMTNGEAVLSNYPVGAELVLTWKTSLVESAIKKGVKKLGYRVETQTKGRADNDYICNNVSFVLAQIKTPFVFFPGFTVMLIVMELIRFVALVKNIILQS